MGLFDHFPYTNVHELNLDWVLSMMKALEAEWDAFTAGNSLTFADPLQHDITKTYAKNTIVLDDNGNAYVSLQAVPVGVGLQNGDYWLMVFDYEAFIEKVNKNFTARYYRGSYRATAAMVIGDWLTVDDILCRATAAIAADDVLEVGVNIEHFTLEQFMKDFVSSVNQTLYNYSLTIQQYKNDIDASELQYKNDIDASELAYQNAMQAEVNRILAGATVDSEVIDARLGENGINYATLGLAIRSQLELALMPQGVQNGSNVDFNNFPVGICRVYGTTNPSHSPVANPFGYVITHNDIKSGNNTETLTQIYFGYTAGVIYIRYSASGSWTSWKKLSSADNADSAYNAMLPPHSFLTGANVDFNNLTKGYYRVYGLTSPSNPPVTNPQGFLMVFNEVEGNNTLFTQIYIDYRAYGQIYIRYNAGGSWVNWERVSKPEMSFLDIITGSGVDFDNIGRGYARVYGTVNPAHAPMDNPFGLLITFWDSTDTLNTNPNKTQIFISYTKKAAYIRYNSNGSWVDWMNIYDEYEHTIIINPNDDLYSIISNMAANTHVIINAGTYDISAHVAALPDTNYDADMHIKSGCWIEGRGMPTIKCWLASKRTYTSVFMFNSGNAKISGINIDAKNTRYAIHDDTANNTATVQFTHIIEDCIIKYEGVAGGTQYADGLSIGGGMGANVTNIIRNNIIESDTSTYPIMYHTSSVVVSGGTVVAPGKVEIRDNYLKTGTIKATALSQDQGTNRDTVAITGNKVNSSVVISNNTANTIKGYVWNNET